jgi:hypothetical protein
MCSQTTGIFYRLESVLRGEPGVLMVSALVALEEICKRLLHFTATETIQPGKFLQFL